MYLGLSFILNLTISLAGHVFGNWTNCIWINVGNQRSKLGHQCLKVISPDGVITSLIIYEKVLLKVETVSLNVTCSHKPLLQVVVPAVLDNISRSVRKMIFCHRCPTTAQHRKSYHRLKVCFVLCWGFVGWFLSIEQYSHMMIVLNPLIIYCINSILQFSYF